MKSLKFVEICIEIIKCGSLNHSVTLHRRYKIQQILRILYNIVYVLNSGFIVIANNMQDIVQYLNQY
jgi:hypothetical protein